MSDRRTTQLCDGGCGTPADFRSCESVVSVDETPNSCPIREDPCAVNKGYRSWSGSTWITNGVFSRFVTVRYMWLTTTVMPMFGSVWQCCVDHIVLP